MPASAAKQRLNYTTAAPKIAPRTSPKPAFQVHEGEGRGANAERRQNHMIMSLFQLGLLVIIATFILSLARVGLTAACVSELSSNSDLKEQVSEVQDKNRSLQVEKAVLSSTSRISSIAEQNLGMVYMQPGSADTISIS